MFEVAAKIRLDTSDYEKNVHGAVDKTKKLASNISSGIATAAKIGAAALGVASAGVAALTKKSIDQYAEYEQLVGGIETLFKSSSDKVMAYAEKAYATAGMSTNKYMEIVTSFSASLLQSFSGDAEKTASKTAEQVEKTATAQYEAAVKAYEKQYKQAEKSFDRQYKALEKSLDAEIDAYERATDEKVKQINREYSEKLKLIDEEKYNRLKAIDAQIDALNAQTDAEQAEIERREQNEKKAELSNKVLSARTSKERAAAQKELSDYIATLKQKEVENERKKEIEKLRDQKETIKDQAEERKDALKEQQDSKINQIREAEKAQLAIMKESKQIQLETLKEANEEKLENLKSYYDKQKQLAKEAAEAQIRFAEEANSASVGNLTAEQYEKAAEAADMAIKDMSDNANKMGTNIQSIQDAYQGFAKQNYTMLDNLKLGYGGTKTEMERLLKDATALSGVEYNIDNLADVYTAIHVIQEEMGITGTTAKEASTTIQGSFSMLSAAWTNLLTGLSNKDADLDKLINDVVDSAETAFGNILPVAEQALSSIASLIERLAPLIAEKLPSLITQVLPPLLRAAGEIINGIVAALPELITVLAEQAPTIIISLVDAILDNLYLIIDAALQLIIALANGLLEALPEVIDRIPEIIEAITDAIVNNLPLLLEVGGQLIVGLGEGLIKAIPELLKALGRVVKEFLASIMSLFGIHSPSRVFADIGRNLIYGLIDGITALLSNLKDKASEIFASIKDAIGDKISDAVTWGRDLMDNFIGGITDRLSSLWDTVSGVASGIRDFIGFSEPKKGPLSNFHTYAPDMMALFAQGIKDNTKIITDQLDKSFNFGNLGEGAYSMSGGVAVPFAGVGGTAAGNQNTAVTRLLTEILAALRNMGVYIDGDALVGALSPGMQNQFGMAALRTR